MHRFSPSLFFPAAPLLIPRLLSPHLLDPTWITSHMSTSINNMSPKYPHKDEAHPRIPAFLLISQFCACSPTNIYLLFSSLQYDMPLHLNCLFSTSPFIPWIHLHQFPSFPSSFFLTKHSSILHAVLLIQVLSMPVCMVRPLRRSRLPRLILLTKWWLVSCFHSLHDSQALISPANILLVFIQLSR